MRNSGTRLSIESIPTAGHRRANTLQRSSRTQALLVGLGLPHDFLRREIDAAGRERVADEEIVGLLRVEILTVLEIGILGNGQGKLDRLRDDLALQGVDR